ncbi:SufS family cysteine desulfurase [Entomobacter blattae]|nr:SufS family cysteine desulfurase [Entomobacter blattae]
MTDPVQNDIEGKILQLRKDFPILAQKVHGKPLVFLDSAASAQKPVKVIEALRAVFTSQYANIHRGLHWMSEKTTQAYEESRQKVARFLGAPTSQEIIFTKNSTEAINLVSYSYGSLLKPGQAIVISEMEHHANIVPWQLLRDRVGIELRVAPITDCGELDEEAFKTLLSDGKVALVALTHMSNVLGTIVDIQHYAALAHAAGAKILVDGSQSVVHFPVHVTDLDVDFYTFTGHKLYGPTGVGVLWARSEILHAMPPFMGGGDMISSVSFEHTTWADIPHKFEAGTPAIAEVIALGAAIDYVEEIGFETLKNIERYQLSYAIEKLSQINSLKILGSASKRGGVISFVMEGVHPHDMATLLDKNGIAIRAGQHCAEPLMKRLGVFATARASFGLYNTHEEIETLAKTLLQIRTLLQ